MVTATTGWVAKDGRDPGENEDRVHAGARRFAVADGAATSARAEVWAEILVLAFAADDADVFDPAVLQQLRHRWRREVYLPDLPWYAVAKLELGGAAAFVGLEVDPERRRYQAVAVGDSCMIHTRGGGIVAVGPVTHWKDFGRFPSLLTTNVDDDSFRDALWRLDGEYEVGDAFMLVSDAMARHLLRRHDHNQDIDVADVLVSDEVFTAWVVHARANDGLGNDDTTICLVEP